MKEQNITSFKLNSKETNVFIFLYNINMYINFRLRFLNAWIGLGCSGSKARTSTQPIIHRFK